LCLALAEGCTGVQFEHPLWFRAHGNNVIRTVDGMVRIQWDAAGQSFECCQSRQRRPTRDRGSMSVPKLAHMRQDGQVVINDDRVHAVVAEVLAQGAAGRRHCLRSAGQGERREADRRM
jgi:hypothetical protein